MTDVLNSLESGEKYELAVPGLAYTILLPYVSLPAEDRQIKIASLNLVGQIRLNRDLGALLADEIRRRIPDLAGVVILTVVEKALQVAQVAAQQLGMDHVAVAYNRVKPHMEASRRPTIQTGVDSITSGGKFLAVYERDISLIRGATKGVILIDDVVSTGSTIFGLTSLVEEVGRQAQRPDPPQILAIFCVAHEGDQRPVLPAPLYSLCALPAPEIVVNA